MNTTTTTTTTTTPTTPTPRTAASASPGSAGRSGTVRRVSALTKANAKLMTRNRLTLLYATVMPLLPLAFMVNNRGDAEVGATAIGGVLMLTALFPVYYNVLSLFVTRRDELVLKRLRTGETRDGEQLAALALPGSIVAVLVLAIAVGGGAAFGLDLPTNPLLYLVTGLAATVIFAGLAFVTASFTANAEAAQITSMPVMALAVVGGLVEIMPDWAVPVVERTPMAAIDSLMRISWFGELDGNSLSFAETWAEAAQPMVVLAAWAVVSVALVGRYLRWEPRA